VATQYDAAADQARATKTKRIVQRGFCVIIAPSNAVRRYLSRGKPQAGPLTWMQPGPLLQARVEPRNRRGTY